MKTQSDIQQPKFLTIGDDLHINFNETITQIGVEDGETVTMYNYETAIVKKTCDYRQRVEAIVAVRYPTYGAELAAMRDADKATTHDEFVTFAKSLATESMEVK